MPIAKIQGTSIYYEVHGNGEPIICIPGLSADHDMFAPQVNFFKSTHQIICLDLRGNGQSGRLTVPHKEIVAIQCDDIAKLMDYLHIEKATFIGVSYGGMIIQKFNYLFPEKVKALIIVDSFCNTRIDSLLKIGVMIVVRTMWVTYLPRKWLAYAIRKSYTDWPIASDYLQKMIYQLRRKEVVKQRLAMNETNFTTFLPGFRVPTLGIVGGHTEIGVELMKEVTNHIPGARLEIFEHSFDPSNLCQPERFNKTVAAFLSTY